MVDVHLASIGGRPDKTWLPCRKWSGMNYYFLQGFICLFEIICTYGTGWTMLSRALCLYFLSQKTAIKYTLWSFLWPRIGVRASRGWPAYICIYVFVNLSVLAGTHKFMLSLWLRHTGSIKAKCTVMVSKHHCGQTFRTCLGGWEGRSPVRRRVWGAAPWIFCWWLLSIFGNFLVLKDRILGNTDVQKIQAQRDRDYRYFEAVSSRGKEWYVVVLPKYCHGPVRSFWTKACSP